ncbi:amidohydrolase family protein [Foetidibacter luteolus]|uniref:amidohydrolase family protein n=1 Tax=Foetidibacter luteolus TaxID=2608880 RepID=UPI00129B5AFB|nr:amidohydrolase family protein [Foetidibacter luteolus]
MIKISFLLLSVILLHITLNSNGQQAYTAFTGATIIDGTGNQPVTNGTLLVQHGRIIAIGKAGEVKIPQGAVVKNVQGKTIMPGIINGHGHVGESKGIDGGHYNYANIVDNLAIYARYGITSVVSLGGDKKEAEPLRAIHDSAATGRARLFIAGEIINGNNVQEALTVVDANNSMGVDIMKIRVDDQLGTSPKMPAAIYWPVIRRAHALGYKIASHLYYLEDARDLLNAGTDMLAHSVRDKPVDDAFIALLKVKKASYCPTLTRELSTFVYGDTAAFFADPFFQKEYAAAIIQPLLNPARQQQIRNSKAAITYKQQLPVALANLKKLQDNDIPIVFGTDSGVPTRFMGYFEHVEMQMMAEAGLTPIQIIVSATKNAAENLGLKGLGMLAPGNWADFLVLDANPLDDIKNTKQIAAVYVNGVEVKR